MPKRTVVLGGAGLIGTHLCLRLLQQGHEVFCVDIRDAASSPLLRPVLTHPGFRYVHHNIIQPFGIRCNEIYNLAAPSTVRYNKALPVETLKGSILGAINALDAARTEHARVLFASTGDVTTTGFRDPTHGNKGVCTTHHMLSEGKRAAEMLHHAYQVEFGVDTRIARIFNTYGTGADPMDQRMVVKSIVAALHNRDIHINGSGEQMRTFCWVEDIVDGLMRLMAAPADEKPRTVSLGSMHEISIRGLAEKIISLTGSRSRIVHVEPRADDPRLRAPDISAARRELEWTPTTPLQEGLKRTISYLQQELRDKTYAAMTWAEMN